MNPFPAHACTGERATNAVFFGEGGLGDLHLHCHPILFVVVLGHREHADGTRVEMACVRWSKTVELLRVPTWFLFSPTGGCGDTYYTLNPASLGVSRTKR